MPKGDKRIKILNDREIDNLYSLPKFTFEDQIVFFSLNNQEQKVLSCIQDFATKVHFVLQLGYFKAKKKLFQYNYQDVKHDILFIINQNFTRGRTYRTILHKAKKLQNNKRILELLQFKEFNKSVRVQLVEHTILLTRQHVCHLDIFRELITYIEVQRITLPDYTIMQDIISLSINVEQRRLDNKINEALAPELSELLEKMLSSNETLGLNVFKKLPKNFCYNALKNEVAKGAELKKLYLFSKVFLPCLEISQNNIQYYAKVAEQYSISHLKKLKLSTAKLYLLCYLHYRYQQINDNLMVSIKYYANKFSKDAENFAQEQLITYTQKQHNNLSKVSNLLRFISKEDTEKMTHEEFYQQAYVILPKVEYMPTANYLDGESFDHEQAKWEFYLHASNRIKKYFRPLIKHLKFGCDTKDAPIMLGIKFLQQEISKSKVSLSKIPDHKFPKGFIPKNKRKYLKYEINTSITKEFDPSKYEVYTYLKLADMIEQGKIYCEESTKYKSFKSDLVSDDIWKDKKNLLTNLTYPNISINIKDRLASLEQELHDKILVVNEHIANGENKDFKIKHKDKNTTWHLSYPSVAEEVNHSFFAQLGNMNLTDVIYFVNQETQFLSAFTHIRYKHIRQDTVIACIMANGLGFGTYKMSQTSDIVINELNTTERNFIRIETLRKANDLIVNKVSKMRIFDYWRIIDDKLFSGVDGQKYETKLKTIQSRYSPKYFGLKQGIVAYTLQTNHIPINTQVIGANEHESHFLFDILSNNTSEIDPDLVTGDMHSINCLNYAILDAINKLFVPNFNDAQSEIISSLKPLKTYEKYFIKPTKFINAELIKSEWDNIQRIFVSLVLQETNQSTIVRKLSSSKSNNKIKKALSEYNEIFKSLHLLDFIDDSLLRAYIRKTLNRTEGYHQLRRTISKVGSGQFKNQSTSENEIWNHCSRLIANCIIYYNAVLLNKTLELLVAENVTTLIDNIKLISPVVWQHINMTGKYEFTKQKAVIDIEKMAKQLQKTLKEEK